MGSLEIRINTAESAESAEMTKEERFDRITGSIIGAAIEVHRALGPGLLESAYEACLTFELVQRGLNSACPAVNKHDDI